jgi:hypothetical protein
VRFSARIDSSEEIPGLPDMGELSLEGAESAKQITARLETCADANLSLPFRCVDSRAKAVACATISCLALFHLSGGPILEEEIYA